MLLVLPFRGPGTPHHLVSLPGVRCGPVTNTTCLPAQILDTHPSAKALSVQIEIVCIRASTCTGAHTHTHTHWQKVIQILNFIWYVQTFYEDVSEAQFTHEWKERICFPEFWMLDFLTIIVHLIGKRQVLISLAWMCLNNIWGQTE